MEQKHIQAYRLLLEFAEIQKITDTLKRGIAMQQWGDKATTFIRLNPSYPAPALALVKEKRRQPPQNCVDANQQA